MYEVQTERLGPLCRVSREVEKAEMGPQFAKFKHRDVRPSPRSFHESTLDKSSWKLPAINQMDQLQNSLQKDQFRQAAVYRDSAQPLSGRFNVALPRSPQHTKYCYKSSASNQPHEHEDASTSSPASAASKTGNATSETKFSTQMLRDMFPQFATGEQKISHRKLLALLQNRSDFMEKLTQLLEASWHQDETSNNMHHEHFDEDPTSRLRGQISKFREVLHEMEGDSSGEMEWEEFLEFFRRCDLLSEHNRECNTHYKRHGLDHLAMELNGTRAAPADFFRV